MFSLYDYLSIVEKREINLTLSYNWNFCYFEIL